MNKHRYVYETALTSSDKTIPWPYALAAMLILAAAVGWFAESNLRSRRHTSLNLPAPTLATSHAPASAHAGKVTSKANHHRLMS